MKDKLKARWTALNASMRILLITIAIAIPIGVIGAMYMMKSSYEVLYTGLTPEDSTAIERFLSDAGVNYKTTDGTIEVDGDIIKIKRELAMEGLPSGGVTSGLDNFGQTSLGSTRYDKDVQYQTGLQKDLNKNLTEMFEGIQKAEVKLPKPKEKSIFEDKNEAVEVSVALKLRTGVELDSEQVSAIQVFVAGALSDVKPENVKVVDSKMNVLSDYDKDEKGANKQQEIVNEAKTQLEKQLSDTLSDVYGSVKVIATVDINFDEIVQNIKKYDPQGTLLSKETDKETTRQIEGVDNLEPGTDANGEVPNYEIEDLEEQGDVILAQDKEHIIENFQVSETVEQIIKHPELRNLNVAVWVDGNLTDPEITELEEMIAVASGLKGEATRDENNKAIYENGSVKVSQKTFKTQPQNANEDPFSDEPAEESTIPWIIYAIAGGLALLIIAVLLLVMARSRKKKKQEELDLLKAQEEANKKAADEITPKSQEEEQIENEILEGIQGFKIGRLSKQQQDLREVAGEAATKHAKETADWVKKQLND